MERKGGLRKYDIVVGLLDPKDPTSARQSILIEKIDDTTSIVLGDEEDLNKVWTLYEMDNIVVDPKNITLDQKHRIRKLKKMSLKK